MLLFLWSQTRERSIYGRSLQCRCFVTLSVRLPVFFGFIVVGFFYLPKAGKGIFITVKMKEAQHNVKSNGDTGKQINNKLLNGHEKKKKIFCIVHVHDAKSESKTFSTHLDGARYRPNFSSLQMISNTAFSQSVSLHFSPTSCFFTFICIPSVCTLSRI